VLRSRFDVTGDDSPVPAIAALMRFCDEIIDENPTLYLAYVLWAEYFMTLVGGESTRPTTSRSSIDSSRTRPC
jgi:hypothetical protein